LSNRRKKEEVFLLSIFFLLIEHARHHPFGVRRLQAPQLQHDEEQEEDDGAARVQQVLPVLPEAHGAQGNEVIVGLTN
jgi:hypothetical protein